VQPLSQSARADSATKGQSTAGTEQFPNGSINRSSRRRGLLSAMDTESAALAHLYRRAGFGATFSEIEAALEQGYEQTVRSWVATLATPDPAATSVPPPELVQVPTSFAALPAGSTARRQFVASARRQLPILVQWWVARMVAAANPLTEKLVLVLHNQFPTAVSKVQFPSLMLAQNQLFRSIGQGPFDSLTQAVSKDPAMLVWLDASSDNKAHPNENFARELMERFTMGIGAYTQADVTAAAVCFTGWRYDLSTGGFAFEARAHDYSPQTFLGRPGVNTGEDVIDIATHSEASFRWVTSRIWSFLAYPVGPSDPVVADLVPVYAEDLSLSNLVQAVLLDPRFVSDRSLQGLVKQPVEWVAGALKALGFSAASIAGGTPSLYGVLAGLGQVPFDPPSVGGWPQNQGWLSTASALARWQWATEITRSEGADLSLVVDSPAADRPDAAAKLLSVAAWSPPTASALARVARDPTSLVSLALVSPEYVAN
jgi:uncharacterized protein (DUF1800 family)